MPWAEGPAHPAGDEYDLETVILHELGAFAPLIGRAVVLRHGRVVHDGAPPRPRDEHAGAHHDHLHAHPDPEPPGTGPSLSVEVTP